MNICSTLPGEHLWSVVARSLKWSGFTKETTFTAKYGLDASQIKPSKGNCKNLALLTQSEEFCSLQNSGSSYPLWLLNFDNIETAIQELSTNHLSQARESQVNLSANWRYCPMCMEEDRSRYGTAYWHNAHNLPFVTHCTHHNVPLVQVSGLKSISSLSMPNRLKSARIDTLGYSDDFQQWSHFVVAIYNTINDDFHSVARLRNLIWDRFGPVPNAVSKRRDYFNELLAKFEAHVPENLLKHCFQFYDGEKRRRSNILYTTYKRDGVQIRHPVYMLMILYWLQCEGTTVIDEKYAKKPSKLLKSQTNKIGNFKDDASISSCY
jgi:hypothetical protein